MTALAGLLLSITFPNDPPRKRGSRERRAKELPWSVAPGVCCPELISTRFESRVGHSGTQPGRVSLHRID